MCKVLSSITSIVLKKESQDKLRPTVLAGDITGQDRIDANSDKQVTVDELKAAAKLAGVNTDNLSETELKGLVDDALNLTEFLQKGGRLSHNSNQVYNYEFVDKMIVTPTLNDLKDNDLPNTKKNEIPVFRRGQSGPEIAKLNILLGNLGFKVKPGNENKFTEETETFIRNFQIENQILFTYENGKPNLDVEPGVIDSNTLNALERSTKAENPYIPIDSPENNLITEFDVVRQKVKQQLSEKGIDVTKAFEIGEKLTEGSVGIDRTMNSDELCYTAVKKSLDKVLGLPYQYFDKVKNPVTGNTEKGSHAKTAGYTLLDKNPDLFVKLDGFSRKDVQFLPPGAIVVYRPIDSKGAELQKEAGHIGVQSLQIKGLPVVKIEEDNGIIRSLTVKKLNNTYINYQVQDGFAVSGKTFEKKDEIAVGKKFNGLPISEIIEENGMITGIKVKGTGKNGTYYKNYDVSGNLVILEKLKIDHADISDKMRFSCWKSSKVEVYFPINSLK